MPRRVNADPADVRARRDPPYLAITGLNPLRVEMQRSALYARGWAPASVGLILCFFAGMFLAQVGGGDREFFATIGYFLGSAGLLGIVIGGVAIGIQLAGG